MKNEIEKGDTIVLKNPRITASDQRNLEQYKIDNIGSDSVDLVHVDKTEVIDGDEVKIQKNIDKDVLIRSIDQGKIALLKNPLEILYHY